MSDEKDSILISDFRSHDESDNGKTHTFTLHKRSEWQPIETAPKDRTIIDLWISNGDGSGKRVPDAYWTNSGFDFGPVRGDGTPGWGAANMGYDGCDGYADDPKDGVVATHWIAQPEPPTP